MDFSSLSILSPAPALGGHRHGEGWNTRIVSPAQLGCCSRFVRSVAGPATDADISLQAPTVRRGLSWICKTSSSASPQFTNSRESSRCYASAATLSVDEPHVGSDLGSLKKDLLSIVAGLDCGLLAGKDDVSATDSAASKLEAAGGTVEFPDQLEKLQGRWKLVYSSAFTSGNLGGSRPGPPAGRLPLTLGQVYQRIDTFSQEFDNIVDLRINLFWPLPVLEVTATLAHKFELTGKSGIRIVFERTRLKAGGGLSELPPFDLPQLPEFLRPSANSRRGQFEVTFLDDDFRITRGDRGELRIFVKV